MCLQGISRLQRHIYWLNSLGFHRCLLVTDIEDLRDGVALHEVASALLGVRVLPSDRGGGGIQTLVELLGKLHSERGWIPEGGRSVAAAASAIFLGNQDVLCDVLGFLEGLAAESPEALNAQPITVSSLSSSVDRMSLAPER